MLVTPYNPSIQIRIVLHSLYLSLLQRYYSFIGLANIYLINDK